MPISTNLSNLPQSSQFCWSIGCDRKCWLHFNHHLIGHQCIDFTLLLFFNYWLRSLGIGNMLRQTPGLQVSPNLQDSDQKQLRFTDWWWLSKLDINTEEQWAGLHEYSRQNLDGNTTLEKCQHFTFMIFNLAGWSQSWLQLKLLQNESHHKTGSFWIIAIQPSCHANED